MFQLPRRFGRSPSCTVRRLIISTQLHLQSISYYLGVPRDPTEFIFAMGELAFQTVAAGPLLFPVAAELALEPNREQC
jgi:hypothetical protein